MGTFIPNPIAASTPSYISEPKVTLAPPIVNSYTPPIIGISGSQLFSITHPVFSADPQPETLLSSPTEILLPYTANSSDINHDSSSPAVQAPFTSFLSDSASISYASPVLYSFTMTGTNQAGVPFTAIIPGSLHQFRSPVRLQAGVPIRPRSHSVLPRKLDLEFRIASCQSFWACKQVQIPLRMLHCQPLQQEPIHRPYQEFRWPATHP